MASCEKPRVVRALIGQFVQSESEHAPCGIASNVGYGAARLQERGRLINSTYLLDCSHHYSYPSLLHTSHMEAEGWLLRSSAQKACICALKQVLLAVKSRNQVK